ncbi:helix-turn-helix domain-containing protein [Spiractinospora alimapuensis]|uniref:helix-turn-helix domain-containing protein n=1 Tax=Spiractinospora alimapuensis TaxID=2820884 RepID=UPI001F1B6182|nr:helix-turn-helix transcriptional regulator [Spiractinospora alimapuensis]QVQ51741.1 helix-turn-helix domain-containing protein [Spiractinospora alimapuensis]
MPSDPVMSVRHRQLSAELRRLRQARGVNAAEVADAMGWDRTKVNRMERGKWKRLNPQDIRALAEYYGVSEGQERDALVELAKQSKLKGWWERYGDLLGSSSYVALEAEAESLWSYEALVIPGLFQTADYASAMLRGRVSLDVIERRTQLRLARQERLHGAGALSVCSVIDEAALRKFIGSAEIMRAQLRHLIAANEQPNVELRIVPNSAGAHPGVAGQFVVLDFPLAPGASVVFLENAHDGFYLDDPAHVEQYRHIYNGVRELSLDVHQSVEFMRGLHDELEWPS